MTDAYLQEYLLYACKGAQLRKSRGIMELGNQAKFDVRCFIFTCKTTKNVNSVDICQPLLISKGGRRERRNGSKTSGFVLMKISVCSCS